MFTQPKARKSPAGPFSIYELDIQEQMNKYKLSRKQVFEKKKADLLKQLNK